MMSVHILIVQMVRLKIVMGIVVQEIGLVIVIVMMDLIYITVYLYILTVKNLIVIMEIVHHVKEE